ncbi:MAG: alpha/beta fold hydrolase [Sarcina sp.]
MELKKIEMKGFTIGYYEEGEGDCILCLHGNGMHSRQFEKIYNKLKIHNKVIAIDFRGSGESTRTDEKITLSLIVDDVLEFLKIKKIKKVSIIGYSDGANFAMLLAKKDPSIINKLILICGNYKVEGICLWFRALLKIYDSLLSVIAPISKWAKNRNELLNLMFENLNLTDEDLGRIKAQTLVFYSSIDVIHKGHSKKIAELIPNSKLILAKGTNHENIIRNEKVINEIIDFIE